MRDEELLARHIAGDARAFDTLVSRYANGLYAFFQRLVGSSAAADDLVQETFLQVHLSAATFDPSRTFRPWLYTVAANKGRDFIRNRGRRATVSLDRGSDDENTGGPAIESDELQPETQVAGEDQAEAVRRIVDRMPEHLRMILTLGYFERLPYGEIAEILDIPVGTVKSRLHSAVNYFAQRWLAQHAREEERA